MDALDELNGKLEELCGIAERERERILTDLMHPFTREDTAEWALDYARWSHILDGFRAQLIQRGAPIARVK